MDLGGFGFRNQIFPSLIGEFDPGSERTLAACLTHASRAVTGTACCPLTSGERVSNTWVIYLSVRNNPRKLELMPDKTTLCLSVGKEGASSEPLAD